MKQVVKNKTPLPANVHTIEVIEDEYNGGYRVRRATWPSDTFEIMSEEQLTAFKATCAAPDFATFFPIVFVEVDLD